MRSIRDVLAHRGVVLYDGGFGTELFARGVDLPNSSLASELHPDVVRQVTQAYIEAGCDLVQTNTFVASPLHLAMAGRSAEDSAQIVSAAVRLARDAVEGAGRPVYVSGSIGPSPGRDRGRRGRHHLRHTGRPGARGASPVAGKLAAAGADLVPRNDVLRTEAVIADEARAFGLPIAVNLTPSTSGTGGAGRPCPHRAAGTRARTCSTCDIRPLRANGDDLLPFVDAARRELRRRAAPPGAHRCALRGRGDPELQSGWPSAASPASGDGLPNAGMPRIVAGATHYDHTPERMGSEAQEVVAAGASISAAAAAPGRAHPRHPRGAMPADHRSVRRSACSEKPSSRGTFVGAGAAPIAEHASAASR